jgi:hypothetical protein
LDCRILEDQIPTISGFQSNWQESDQYGQNLEISAESGDSAKFWQIKFLPSWNPATVARFCFTPSVIFSYESNAKKYLQENYFPEK